MPVQPVQEEMHHPRSLPARLFLVKVLQEENVIIGHKERIKYGQYEIIYRVNIFSANFDVEGNEHVGDREPQERRDCADHFLAIRKSFYGLVDETDEVILYVSQ
jgi:hypothetical protein